GSEHATYTGGEGGTGNLPGIPLNNHTFSAGPGAPVGFSHSRSSTWNFSGKQSRVFLDARTPSPYGEVKAYIEFDFSASNTNTILNHNQGSVNGYIPRFRQGYATLGGLLAGQTQGTFTDNDSDPELLDFGGTTASLFVSRTPQVRYTYPLAYGMSVAVAAENPNPNYAGPFGTFFTDTNQIPNSVRRANNAGDQRHGDWHGNNRRDDGGVQHHQCLPRQRGVLQPVAGHYAHLCRAVADRAALGPYPGGFVDGPLCAERRHVPEQAVSGLWRSSVWQFIHLGQGQFDLERRRGRRAWRSDQQQRRRRDQFRRRAHRPGGQRHRQPLDLQH